MIAYADAMHFICSHEVSTLSYRVPRSLNGYVTAHICMQISQAVVYQAGSFSTQGTDSHETCHDVEPLANRSTGLPLDIYPGLAELPPDKAGRLFIKLLRSLRLTSCFDNQRVKPPNDYTSISQAGSIYCLVPVRLPGTRTCEPSPLPQNIMASLDISYASFSDNLHTTLTSYITQISPPGRVPAPALAIMASAAIAHKVNVHVPHIHHGLRA